MYHLEPQGLAQNGTEPRVFNIMLEHEIVGEVRRRRQDWELTLGAYQKGFAMLIEVRKFLDEFKGNPRKATRTMAKIKGIVCAEMTADGPRQFAVDSEATFDAYVQLSEWGSNEAEHWGGFKFDLDPEAEDTYDADGENLNPDDLERCQVMTMDEINSATTDNIDEEDDEHDSEAYETAFLAVRDGDYRKE